jgi:D-inositol-3-phosphate glycosyltransferase
VFRGSLLAAPEHRARLSAGALTHARNFSWGRTVHGLLEVYRDALAASHARRLKLVS